MNHFSLKPVTSHSSGDLAQRSPDVVFSVCPVAFVVHRSVGARGFSGGRAFLYLSGSGKEKTAFVALQ